MKKEECYQLGKITKLHGLKGELIIFLDVDYPEDYEEMDSVFVEVRQVLVPYFIDTIQIQKDNRAIVQFEDVTDMDIAKTLINCDLYLPLDVLPEPDENKFYLHEVINFMVVDIHKGKLGVITNIYEGAQQDVMGMQYQGKEILIPIVDAIVLQVNQEKQEIEVNLPDGLIEVYLED